MEHTEEDDHHTDQEGGQSPEVIEAPIAKPRRKMTYTPEQLEKKRESMKKAREFRNISYKEEVKTLKKKLEEKEKEPEPEEEEPEPEPVKKIVRKTVSKPKPQKKIIYEEEEDDDDDEYEEVIVRRRAICPSRGQRPKTIPRQKQQYIERPDLIDETYKEKLQKQLQDERRRQVMADLFDF